MRNKSRFPEGSDRVQQIVLLSRVRGTPKSVVGPLDIFAWVFRRDTGPALAAGPFHVTCVTVWTLFSVNNLGNYLFAMIYMHIL